MTLKTVIHEMATLTSPEHESWVVKGDRMLELGKTDEALKCYDTALKLNPNDEIAKRNRERLIKKKQF